MADLAVIIVSFNSAGYLRPCLESVRARSGDVVQDVVVVDNGSADGSPELVEREFPWVRVLRNENRGFAHANNRGFETVDAPFVLFLNPDTEIREGTFADLLRLMGERSGVGLVGCRQLDEDGAVYPTIRRFPRPARHLFEALGSERLPVRPDWMGERELDLPAYDRESRCDWVSGSFMLARREAVLDAGMMDERYFLFSEETDLCAGIEAAGWEVRYVPDMTILHHFGKNGHNERLVAQEAYARRQYMYKHMGMVQRSLCTAALALCYARRAFDSLARDDDARSRRAAARTALRTLMGMAPPPFGELSGPLRGPRLADR
jgi:GT2 family glycosyltransferase